MINSKNLPPATKLINESDFHIPLIVHTQVSGLPNQATIEAEKVLARDNRLFHHIAVLSDAHKKKDISNPASSVAVSQTHVIPQLFDSAPNCGMRIITTDLTDQDLTTVKVNELFNELIHAIPARTYVGISVPKQVIVDSYIKGSAPVARYLNMRVKNEIENTYKNGNLFNGLDAQYQLRNLKDLLEIIPPLLINLGRHRLGILGATSSHFLTLMKVDKVLDKAKADRLGIKQGQYIFYMHTGSGIIGRYIGYLYSPQPRKLRQEIEFTITKLGWHSPKYKKVRQMLREARKNGTMVGFEANSIEGQMCVKALQAAGNQGFANRTMLTHQMDLALEKIFGRQIDLRLVYDAPHILLSKERHYDNDVWVHRNGATRAINGEPGLLAPYESTYGYLGVGTNNNQTTFHSANHELGKPSFVTSKVLSSIPKPPTNLTFSSVKTYTKKEGVRNIKPQPLHAAYAETIAAEIEQNKVLDLVARLKTHTNLTYKHSRRD